MCTLNVGLHCMYLQASLGIIDGITAVYSCKNTAHKYMYNLKT